VNNSFVLAQLKPKKGKRVHETSHRHLGTVDSLGSDRG